MTHWGEEKRSNEKKISLINLKKSFHSIRKQEATLGNHLFLEAEAPQSMA